MRSLRELRPSSGFVGAVVLLVGCECPAANRHDVQNCRPDQSAGSA